MLDASWVIENKQTGKPVLEAYDFEMVQFVNLDKYRVWPVLCWLYEVNGRVKDGRFYDK